jgi:hypothetical protein
VSIGKACCTFSVPCVASRSSREIRRDCMHVFELRAACGIVGGFRPDCFVVLGDLSRTVIIV